MSVVYHLCDNCNAAIVNNDYSAFDLNDTDTDYERVTAFVERVGYLVDAGTVDPGHGGYWECEACEQVEIGSGNAMETV